MPTFGVKCKVGLNLVGVKDKIYFIQRKKDYTYLSVVIRQYILSLNVLN